MSTSRRKGSIGSVGEYSMLLQFRTANGTSRQGELRPGHSAVTAAGGGGAGELQEARGHTRRIGILSAAPERCVVKFPIFRV